MSPAGPLRRAVGSWRAAVRIAVQEARRARGRTALVLAMITLPVLALTFAAVTWDMFQITAQEEAPRRMGGADAQLRMVNGEPLGQPADGDRAGTPAGQRPVAADLITSLPSGSRVVPLVEQSRMRLLSRGGGVSILPVRGIDVGDPLVRGIVRLRSGRVPSGPDELAATEPALRLLGVAVGGTVTVAGGSRTLRVVGVVEFPANLGAVVAVPPAGLPEPPDVWLVDTPGPVDPDLLRRLQAQGVMVETARVDPVGRAFGTHVTPVDQESIMLGVLVGGLGLLEVVLLTGPAFAVGVRRRQRDLALVAANGGTPAQLRRIVLADGLVLGLAGAGLGLALGITTAIVVRPLVAEQLYQHRPGGYRFLPAALVAIAVLAVLAGLLAAGVPAYTAGRQDVVAGLTGRRGATRSRRRWLLLGLCLTGTGTVTAALAASRVSAWGILTGLVLGEIGLVLCTPHLVGLLGWLGRGLPLALRIALRDTSRNRAAAAPAISAVLAAVAGSVATGVWLASDAALTTSRYQPALPPGYVTVIRLSAEPDRPPLAPASVRELAHTAGVAATTVARLSVPTCGPASAPGDSCWLSVRRPATAACPDPVRWPPDAADRARALADTRCQQPRGAYPTDGFHAESLADDGTVLPLVTGASGDDLVRATAVLRSGGVVVTDPWLLVDGQVTVAVYRSSADGATRTSTGLVLPAYALTSDPGTSARVFYSPGALARAGLAGHDLGFVVGTSAAPADAARKRFTTALTQQEDVQVTVASAGPPLPQAPFGLVLAIAAGLVTLGAAGIATGLAAAEGRADLTTLAAVGAGPGVRRALAVSRAGVIAGVGTLLGVVAGLGAAGTILTAVNRASADAWPPAPPYPLTVPWLSLGILLVVPLLAMLGAGLLTRSRLPIERRFD